MKVPFLDLKTQYESIKDEIDVAIQEVFDSCAFAGGPFVEKFEREFAEFCHCEYCVGVASGTEALWLALLALGIGPDDEVITVPNTFIATAEAISFCGAKPAFVDIDEQTYNMDPQKLHDYLKSRNTNSSLAASTAYGWPPSGGRRSAVHHSSLSGRVKAVIPVHLFGQTADMDPIMEIARSHGLFVIEDACQAHGAEYKGKVAGSMGDIGCFSFYPGKNLGAYGEAGAIVTNNAELADKVRILRDHGQLRKYQHTKIGWNSRMDGVQGAVLSVKLKYLENWNHARRRNAQSYTELLNGMDEIILQKEREWAKHIYHIYALRVRNRHALIKYLSDNEIFCGIHYPTPVHVTEAYQSFEFSNGNFPIAEKCADELISLPMFPELTRDQVNRVAYKIEEFFSTGFRQPEPFSLNIEHFAVNR